MRKLQRRGAWAFGAALLLLALALPLSLMGAVCFGTTRLSFGQVYGVIYYELAHLLAGAPIPQAWAPGTAVHDVVWLIRLPRLVLAAAVGGGLSLCGVVMQAVVKIRWRIPMCWGCPPGRLWAPPLPSCLGWERALGETSWG